MKRYIGAFAALALVVAATGCASPDPNARQNASVADRASFAPVAKVLVRRCGTIDCHGSPYRNYRLYGYQGRRLNPAHKPDAPDTTDAELAANYDATVGIEPELFAEVIAAKGASPSKLTLVRKARGEESHKGGARIAPDDAADKCLVAWLRSAPDEAACSEALKVP